MHTISVEKQRHFRWISQLRCYYYRNGFGLIIAIMELCGVAWLFKTVADCSPKKTSSSRWILCVDAFRCPILMKFYLFSLSFIHVQITLELL